MEGNPLKRAWHTSDIAGFLQQDTDRVVGELVAANPLPTTREQVAAWQEQITILQSSLHGLTGYLFLEFNIPRIGRRIDALLISGPLIFVIEFKVGATDFERAAINQVWDYSLDLKNFHETSHSEKILPILVATKAASCPTYRIEFAQDGVAIPVQCTVETLHTVIHNALSNVHDDSIDINRWYAGSYKPTPTIIEAAQALYARHSVEEIARNDAGASNLRITTKRIEQLIVTAKSEKRKIICFVTGVPGAGKTLVGLDIATRWQKGSSAHAVFLSGNGPLVAVLRAALIRDERERRRALGEKRPKTREANPVKSFIQNVHHFRDDALIDSYSAPVDHVAVFDEAQRAWNLSKTADFMKRRKGISDFQHSEPAFLISYMDRHPDWAVIVCLVGGGQEIHTGEGGISEWLDAVTYNFPKWDLFISPQLSDEEYAAGKALKKVAMHARAQFLDGLHLAVSMRSFRAENLSAFTKALLDVNKQGASRFLFELRDRYPIYLTRSLDTAKAWVRSQARGSERFGILASSKAVRLKPYAIDVRVATDPVHWFLGDSDDIRASQYLEDVATEFQVQGLELDWTIVTWDGDLRIGDNGWTYHDFRGSRWRRVLKREQQDFLKNAYRVLLTRARQGMIIFIPPGDARDDTRPPSYYDPTFEYLESLGIESL